MLSIVSKHTPSPQTAEITKILSQLISLNKRILFKWIPSHCGILGNENADALAKKGSTAIYRPVTKSTYYSVKRFIKSTYLDFNKQNLITQSQGKKWNSLHQNPQLIPDLPRKLSVAAFRLATGHDCLAKHLYRIGIYQSPNCPLCNSNEEMDSEHLKICASLAGHDNIFEKYWSARGQMTLLKAIVDNYLKNASHELDKVNNNIDHLNQQEERLKKLEKYIKRCFNLQQNCFEEEVESKFSISDCVQHFSEQWMTLEKEQNKLSRRTNRNFKQQLQQLITSRFNEEIRSDVTRMKIITHFCVVLLMMEESAVVAVQEHQGEVFHLTFDGDGDGDGDSSSSRVSRVHGEREDGPFRRYLSSSSVSLEPPRDTEDDDK
ncbi:hypothetical protein ANN_11295 [Periplaneta americana]|uniref:RNase H type-1 domain-containing protein n=1 Tax=Periplaneta americana TaxID=6978 RepID=A0ABQ8T6D5_PERAM|nr:hypothetical protein ANN_11295 [Periplaneta americana]